MACKHGGDLEAILLLYSYGISWVLFEEDSECSEDDCMNKDAEMVVETFHTCDMKNMQALLCTSSVACFFLSFFLFSMHLFEP